MRSREMKMIMEGLFEKKEEKSVGSEGKKAQGDADEKMTDH